MGKNEAFWVLGQHVIVIHGEADYCLIDVFAPGPMLGPPPHIHHDCSELFYMLDGHLEVLNGKETTVLKIGESLYIPPGTLHTFKNPMIKPARFMIVHNPGGFEKFFRDFGVPGEGEEAFNSSTSEEMLQKIKANAGKYGMEIPE